MKQYVLQELQNPEDIIVLVQYLKDPMTVMDTSRPISLYTEDKKDPIMVTIQTKEIKQYVKTIHFTTEYHQSICVNTETVLYRIT